MQHCMCMHVARLQQDELEQHECTMAVHCSDGVHGSTQQAAKAEVEAKKQAEQEAAAAAKAAPKKAGAWGGLPGR
jgi:predicted protein tyrosine phosphatase